MAEFQKLDKTLVIDLGLLILLATVVRLVGVGVAHLPVGDEMFHILAAQSWAMEGSLRIADGSYDRAALFTMMIGELFSIFGDSLVVARIPVLIFGVLWALILFIWVRRSAGRLAAWIAAGLFCTAPHAIELSLYCRMYTLHGTVFLLGTIAVYSLLTDHHAISKKLVLVAASILCFALAIPLQFTTLIGLVGLGTAVFVDSITQYREFILARKYRRWLLLSLTAVAILLALIFLKLNSDLVSVYLQKFNAQHFAKQASDIRYYHKLFLSEYPVLWSLFPLLLLIAAYQKPRLTIFCASLFVVAISLHSLAGAKAERYVYYSLPFLFVIWGIAIAAIAPYLGQFLTEIANRLSAHSPNLKATNSFEFLFRSVSISAIVVIMLVSSNSFSRTVNIMRGQSYYFGTKLSNWEQVQSQLQPMVDEAPIVLTTNFAKTLYYFGRHDIAISKIIVADILGGVEGATDPRSGRPAISSVESVQAVFDQNPHGLIVGEQVEWRNPLRMTGEVTDFIERNATKVSLPAGSRMVAYTW
ncbi:MAG: ArnT family glycosyltransferase [Pseudomonadales bacterium]